jgi:hypothetical protein
MLQDPLFMDIFLDFGCLNHEAHPGILVAETIFILKPIEIPGNPHLASFFGGFNLHVFLETNQILPKKTTSQSSNIGCMVAAKAPRVGATHRWSETAR